MNVNVNHRQNNDQSNVENMPPSISFRTGIHNSFKPVLRFFEKNEI
jgi:hypothetical protein